jgi:hypothetical protein
VVSTYTTSVGQSAWPNTVGAIMETKSATALSEVSQYVESLALELSLLPAFAQDDKSEQASASVRECCRLVNASLKPITHDGDIYARFGSPADVISIDGRSYESAHLAAINEANSFLDFLWFHIDNKGHKHRMEKAYEVLNSATSDDNKARASEYILHRTGFDPQLVNSNWDVSKEVIFDRLNPDWRKAFNVVPSRIARERAGMESDEVPTEDGPCHPYTWRKAGIKFPSNILQRATWSLLDLLWRAPGNTVSYKDLSVPVFADHAMIPTEGQVGKQRTLANSFFKENGISWKVSTSPKGRTVSLIRFQCKSDAVDIPGPKKT